MPALKVEALIKNVVLNIGFFQKRIVFQHHEVFQT